MSANKVPDWATSDPDCFAAWSMLHGDESEHYPPAESDPLVHRPDWLDSIHPVVGGAPTSATASGEIDTDKGDATPLHVVGVAVRRWGTALALVLLEVALEMAEWSRESNKSHTRRLYHLLVGVVDSARRGWWDSALWSLEQGLLEIGPMDPGYAPPPRVVQVQGEVKISVQYKLDPDSDPVTYTCSLPQALALCKRPACGVAAMRIKSALEVHPVVRANRLEAGDLAPECEVLAARLAMLADLSHPEYDGGWSYSARGMAARLRAAATASKSVPELRALLLEGGAVLGRSGSSLAKRIHAAYCEISSAHPEAVEQIGGPAVAMDRIRVIVLSKLLTEWKENSSKGWDFDDRAGRWVQVTRSPGCPITQAPATWTPAGPFEAPNGYEARSRFALAARGGGEYGAELVGTGLVTAPLPPAAKVPVEIPHYVALAPADKKIPGPELVYQRIHGSLEIGGRQHNAHVRAWLTRLYTARCTVLVQLREHTGRELRGVRALAGPPCACDCGTGTDENHVTWCGNEAVVVLSGMPLCSTCFKSYL